ncbi:Crp/Fnr family transcriptional regulator [Hyphomicrobium methylovorum]|uniref:Crp/Fnr family transcriptional regulator n=1 Tax=Hyphomicrobium methylovorum TaxID=84 RepID=UPI0015E6B87A|nr:cyclic nucleotide-binding domain-containing protein [Hyphomicrobium methylovorum]MBA2125346.1 Crp/Fnr family transcriptional regulator [Hyphomicrobium methylovorum]
MLQTVIENAVPAPPGMGSQLSESGPDRELAKNEFLFEANDLKTCIYRVETGGLRITAARPDGTTELVEHALAGDLVGLGFLERHAVSAHAVVHTTVSEIPLSDMEHITHLDPVAKARLDAAVEREFIYRRDSLVRAGQESTTVRLAALLCALSSRNGREGLDSTVLENDLECAVVADYLSVSLDVLALALAQLKMRGLIEPADAGRLQIKDLQGLSELAGQDSCELLQSDLPRGRRRLR